ncbi:helix-turn-helix transcriptional regulator [Methylobacillus flagellatus]|uniref:helix-turn-helix domain-containing protein n=1 Tax=Methylobacillus flagellatus TaxID=405 RepID=UPI002853FDA3|nr:helix-turn-helix transcriptional regulator [Methylobacillus flagellatus]
MSNFQKIRSHLGLSQAGLARALGMSQPNIYKYEKGQDVPPGVARKLIELAAKRGVSLTYDDIYQVKNA